MQTITSEIFLATRKQIRNDTILNVRWAIDEVIKAAPMVEAVDFDIDFGEVPMKLGGIKLHENTTDDVLIMDMGVSWPSDIQVDVKARLRLGPVALEVPVRVTRITFRAVLRVTLKPLSQEIPCFSGVSVTLLEKPHFDASVHLGRGGSGIDVMAVPGLQQLIRWGVTKYAIAPMLVYPNEFFLPSECPVGRPLFALRDSDRPAL